MGWAPGGWWVRTRSEEDAKAYLAERQAERQRIWQRWRGQGRPTVRDWLLFAAVAGALVGLGRAGGLF